MFEDKKPKFIVEFDIYTDRYGGAPCYINERYYSTVILFEDGSAEVIGPNPLLNEEIIFSAVGAIIDVEDCGTTFNQILQL